MTASTFLVATGKVSCFGGPADLGVGPAEGLSCIEPPDLAEWWFSRLFLPAQPAGTSGLARRLDPQACYLAMRWAYGAQGGVSGNILPGWSREQVRRGLFRVSANGRSLYAQAADWGPAADTGRVADLAPALLQGLALATDDIATIEWIG